MNKEATRQIACRLESEPNTSEPALIWRELGTPFVPVGRGQLLACCKAFSSALVIAIREAIALLI